MTQSSDLGFMDRLLEPVARFSGDLPLFPLPNVVLLPLGGLPLHIFEPRYQAMTRFALGGEGLIGMACLRPGWESDYHGRPPLLDVVCIGRIVDHESLPEGRFNLLLRGLVRARILSEQPGGEFRLARATVCQDPVPDRERDLSWRQRLDLLISQAPAELAGPVRKVLGALVACPLPLGLLVDMVAQAIPGAIEDRQQLLQDLDVESRARRVMGLITGAFEVPHRAD